MNEQNRFVLVNGTGYVFVYRNLFLRVEYHLPKMTLFHWQLAHRPYNTVTH